MDALPSKFGGSNIKYPTFIKILQLKAILVKK